MSKALQAEVLYALMAENGLAPRLVIAEEPELESDVVELGEYAYIEVDAESMNIWVTNEFNRFRLEHQVDSYQEVLDVFKGLVA